MISIEKMKKFLGSDEQFIANLMDKFLVESGQDMDKLKAASGRKNWNQVQALSHKILSSTRVFNLEKINSLLERIEIAAEERKTPDLIPFMVEEAEQKWQEITKELKTLRKGIKT